MALCGQADLGGRVPELRRDHGDLCAGGRVRQGGTHSRCHRRRPNWCGHTDTMSLSVIALFHARPRQGGLRECADRHTANKGFDEAG